MYYLLTTQPPRSACGLLIGFGPHTLFSAHPAKARGPPFGCEQTVPGFRLSPRRRPDGGHGFARAAEVTVDDTYLAGMQPGRPLDAVDQDPPWQRHARFFDSARQLEQRQLSRIRAWSATHLAAPKPTMFMFSGRTSSTPTPSSGRPRPTCRVGAGAGARPEQIAPRRHWRCAS